MTTTCHEKNLFHTREFKFIGFIKVFFPFSWQRCTLSLLSRQKGKNLLIYCWRSEFIGGNSSKRSAVKRPVHLERPSKQSWRCSTLFYSTWFNFYLISPPSVNFKETGGEVKAEKCVAKYKIIDVQMFSPPPPSVGFYDKISPSKLIHQTKLDLIRQIFSTHANRRRRRRRRRRKSHFL